MRTWRCQDLAAGAVRDVPAGEEFRVLVVGRSMWPVLRDGDEVLAVRDPGATGARPGDLVVLTRPDVGLIVHRFLWRRADGGLRTRGDGSGRMDPPIPSEDVMGRVLSVLRGGREVMAGGLRRRWAWLVGMVVAAARRVVAPRPERDAA